MMVVINDGGDHDSLLLAIVMIWNPLRNMMISLS